MKDGYVTDILQDGYNFLIRRVKKSSINIESSDADFEKSIDMIRNQKLDGYVRDGYVRDGYVRDGYVRDGYVRDGYVRDGYVRPRYTRLNLNIPSQLADFLKEKAENSCTTMTGQIIQALELVKTLQEWKNKGKIFQIKNPDGSIVEIIFFI